MFDSGGAGRYDGLVPAADPAPTRSPGCPTCGTRLAWQGNAHRPFCSLSCRLIDLGVWLDERYRIAGESVPNDSTPEDRMAHGNG